jgi:hypothetical protein
MVHSHTVQTMILATGARTQRAIDGWQTGQTTSVRLDAHALDRGYGSRAGTAIAITSVGHPGVWYLESTNVALSRTEPHMVRLRSRGTQSSSPCRRHRGRFGKFSTLPFPDVESSLREIS